MKYTRNSRGLLISTLASVMVGGFAFVNSGASVGGEKSCNATPLTMAIESPSGKLSRLTYCPGSGWQFDEEPEGKTVNVAPIATAQAQPEEAKEPMTVFIDGPTGYTYVWVLDKGWKFVGRVAEQSR